VLTLSNLGLAVSKSDKPEEAEPLFQEAIARMRETQPDELSGLAANLAHYGGLLMTLKRYTEAETHLREALKIRRECLPSGHWLLGQVEARLGSCLSLQGRYAEAEPHLLSGQATLDAAEHAPPKAKTTAIEQLVNHYEALGKSEEAARWRAKLPKVE
jgi:tetratricopeptide (TPR) repeat protein